MKPALDWASFNCHEGRPPKERAQAVGSILARHTPHVMMLQETRRAIPEIVAEAERHGYKMPIWDVCGTALLVQKFLPTRAVRRVLLGTESWEFNGRTHERRAVCEAIVLGYRVGSVHKVPAPEGSAQRAEQYKIGIQRAERYFNKHPRTPIGWIGDWNKTAQGEPGLWTPEALANRTGSIAYPGTKQVIYPVYRKMKMSNVRLLDEGDSDHPLVCGTAQR